MADYEVYVDDDRYRVPSLYLISASSEARARAMVNELWRNSDHHQGVELRCDGERLWGLGSLADVAPMRRQSAPETSGSAL